MTYGSVKNILPCLIGIILGLLESAAIVDECWIVAGLTQVSLFLTSRLTQRNIL